MCLLHTEAGLAEQWSVDSKISATTEYNDNIFLTENNETSVTGLLLSPEVSLAAKDMNWQTILNARFRANYYSDESLNRNSSLLVFSSGYALERDKYAITSSYEVQTSLDVESDLFGLVESQDERELFSVQPEYSRRLSERLSASLGYKYSTVDYDSPLNSNLVPYEMHVTDVSINYFLSEISQVYTALSFTDYESDDGSFDYTMFVYNFGLARQFSEIVSGDIAFGQSKRDTFSRLPQSFNFFGTTITQIFDVDAESDGLVLDAGLKMLLEDGDISGRLSRSNDTSSFGGIDEVDTINILFNKKLNELLSYSISAAYNSVTAINQATTFADRDSLSLSSKIVYRPKRDWTLSVLYGYSQRSFKNIEDEDTPTSNRIYINIAYNFPSFTTF